MLVWKNRKGGNKKWNNVTNVYLEKENMNLPQDLPLDHDRGHILVQHHHYQPNSHLLMLQLENIPQDMDDQQPVYLSQRCMRCMGRRTTNWGWTKIQINLNFFQYKLRETDFPVPTWKMRIEIKRAYNRISNKSIIFKMKSLNC